MRALGWAAVFLTVASSAEAGSSQLGYAPPPAWVAAAPAPTGTAPPAGAAAQMIFFDNQVRLGPAGEERYSAYRAKILSAEALGLGNIVASWNPARDDIRIHGLKLIRDGREIDVLARNKFKVIQRENNLEHAVLDGELTAALQIPGVEVGDEIEFAATIVSRDPTLGDRAQGALSLPSIGSPGAYRLRLVWPKDWPLRWRATPDLGGLKPVPSGGDLVLTHELRDPDTAITADGAPARYKLRRHLEYSGFADWAEVSGLLWPLYRAAATLKSDSPIRAEAARIGAAHDSPGARAAAALRLTQERIRYVYVGLDDGNYRPTSADETWTRRFGDCKAKTALLLALLRELGIAAEPALVASSGGDGTDERLPAAGQFDHVLVRATIDGRSHWLDGTRTGDRDLARLPPPPFRWALPLRSGAASLVKVDPEPPALALDSSILDLDIRGGTAAPAKVRAERTLRGDAAIEYRAALAQLSKADAERLLKAAFVESYDWVEPDTVAWRYDEAQTLLVMSMTGTGEPDWQGEPSAGRRLYLQEVGLSAPGPFRRPKEQDQTVPWKTDFPTYTRATTIVRLPPGDDRFVWRRMVGDMDVEIGGVSYWRESDNSNDVVRITTSVRTISPEFSAEAAKTANRLRSDFDNKVPFIYQAKAESKSSEEALSANAEAEAGGDPEKLRNLVAALADAEQYDRALRLIDKALRSAPGDLDWTMIKAGVLHRQGQLDAAVALIDRAVKAHPRDAELGLYRAYLLGKAGRKPDALAALQALRPMVADDAAMRGSLAKTAWDLGFQAEALALAEEELKRLPDDVTYLQILGAALADRGRWAESLPHMDAAIRLRPEQGANLRNRAYALRKLGRTEEALADLDEALRIDPLDDAALSMKARTLRAAGRKQEAVALYDLLAELEPNATTLNNLCWERALTGLELAKAEAECARALKLSPDAAGIWDSYGLVALRTGRLDEAIRRYDRALALSPKMPQALYARGLARLRNGDATGGRADIAASEAILPRVGEELAEAGLKP
jgi:tetratricopeptide (TPR) repeat protein